MPLLNADVGGHGPTHSERLFFKCAYDFRASLRSGEAQKKLEVTVQPANTKIRGWWCSKRHRKENITFTSLLRTSHSSTMRNSIQILGNNRCL